MLIEKEVLGSGFCLFNNIAIATQKLLNEGKKIAVLDLDGHHGDGTQSIFEGVENVFYCSIHQENTFPGTGKKSKENFFNIPMLSPINEGLYLESVKKCIVEIRKFNPDILAVSMGFDTYIEDKLLNFNLSLHTYKQIGLELHLNFKNIFAVLEGGYHNSIGECVRSFVLGVNSVL